MRRIFIGCILALAIPARAAASAPVSGGGALVPPRRPEQAWQWLAERREEAAALAAREDKALLRARLAEAQSAGVGLARTGGISGKGGYVVYPPRASLALFLLHRASEIYRAALAGGADASLPGPAEYRRLAGERLILTAESKYPSVARVRAALEALAVPESALRGYRVYLLPFAMGQVSGQGGPGFAILAAEPMDEELIPNQLEVTLAHEFGHHLHLSAMPRDSAAGRRLWAEYLRLRGLAWREDGPVNTRAWAGSPEETLAEDFRLLLGGPAARDEPAATAAGDPRERRAVAARLRAFLTELAAAVGGEADPEPWPGWETVPADTALPGSVELAVYALCGALLLLLAGRDGEGRMSAPGLFRS